MTKAVESRSEPFLLPDFLREERGRVEEALQTVREGAPTGTPLGKAAHYALETRGKRIRPILCCAAYRAVRGGEVPEAVYRLACALEVTHTYSLVHDDLPCMDDDDLRRGRPTVHRVYGVPMATLAGAALVPLAVEVLITQAATLGLRSERREALVRELCEASGARGMVGGQFLDLEAESRAVDPTGLEAIHRAKTGALLRASLRIGVMTAEGGDAELDALTRYGEALGLAFQITDDILDETASSGQLGKTAGKDSSVGKATYPALYGLEGARSRARECLEEAEAALAAGGVEARELVALARYVVERTA